MSITIDQCFEIAGAVISVAAVVAAALPTPSPKATMIITVARKVLDVLAFNFGHAKNQAKDETQAKK